MPSADDLGRTARRCRRRDQIRRNAFIATIDRPPVIVPHRRNRVVLFNSDMLHRSGSVSFKPGYENRRINVTLLYGDRAPA